ncbi:dna repair snf2 family [Phaffia rhodozyma]|uniref:Dna repair snf2 family n=1 Tax=Phaffia rhodozyma TaxID=264483 RepID=A0A0F7SN98_PHARH|nr:dna repair snf2 family [Phaffia rhodozyma]
MLRRKSGDSHSLGGGFGALVGMPAFKTPSFVNKRGPSALPPRKRTKKSYKEKGASDDDDDESNKKKPKVTNLTKQAINASVELDENGDPIGEININKKFPIWDASGKDVARKGFSIPTIIKPSGEKITHVVSNIALGVRRQPVLLPRPLFDPMADHAIVLYDPTVDLIETNEERIQREADEVLIRQEAERQKIAEEMDGGLNPHKSLREILGLESKADAARNRKKIVKVPVVIDPKLSKVLRPHQIEGVKFLYRCTTGLLVHDAFGCIMADEMGLGKTLQCIALLHTLLKQSPIPSKATIEKGIIVCPSSLVKNWAKELVKWLGEGVINPLVVDGKGGRQELIPAVRRWVSAKGRSVTQQVMIVSYETLRSLTDELAGCEVGLLLADEGHRLKNAESLTFVALNAIQCTRRVILTGTPVQNDLSEYFALLDFANPGYLGTRLDFRKNFELDILRGRDSDATEKDRAKSDEKLRELGGKVNKFVIRRTNDLLSKYLPVKYEAVVFCSLAPLQLALYRHFIKSPDIRKLLRGTGSQPLKAIGILKKLCNHPDLLDLSKDLQGCEDLLPENYEKDKRASRGPIHSEYGGKFLVLERFLHQLRTTTDDKIVLISNYTQTLDLFQKLCYNNKYPVLRLDGSMAVTKRQKLVDKFNDPNGGQFVFLLSSKAGGCGINLIGANRLILFDPDWVSHSTLHTFGDNPAADQQALARVWRDGQTKECFVYRFITTGTIEEKVFQRQSQKVALSSCVVDDNAETTERHFSVNDLRELFQFNENTLCDTHDIFKCKRCKDGKQITKAPALLYGDTSSWNHFTNQDLGNMHDDLLRAEYGQPDVSFVFQYISH